MREQISSFLILESIVDFAINKFVLQKHPIFVLILCVFKAEYFFKLNDIKHFNSGGKGCPI